MMISPEVYYEEQLKGKTKEQIMRFIRGLKQEIGHLKNMMESPDYAQESVIQVKMCVLTVRVNTWKKQSKPMLKSEEPIPCQNQKKRLLTSS